MFQANINWKPIKVIEVYHSLEITPYIKIQILKSDLIKLVCQGKNR